jgi:uncharacterized protein YktB (UPF0637 family)
MNPCFAEEDFSIFEIDGLTPRMTALKERIQPKFAEIGSEIATFLTTLLQEPVFVHIAKHARRTVHPPDETWVAFATNKRGYKAHPHFQVGLRHSHLFIWFALIYECKQKSLFAEQLQERLDKVWPTLPSHFALSQDHTRPEFTLIQELDQTEVMSILQRLEKVKKAEFLCGLVIPREEAVRWSKATLIQKIEETYQQLYPLYQLSFPLSAPAR